MSDERFMASPTNAATKNTCLCGEAVQPQIVQQDSRNKSSLRGPAAAQVSSLRLLFSSSPCGQCANLRANHSLRPWWARRPHATSSFQVWPPTA